MDDLIGMVKGFAPGIATALGGPLAGMAVSMRFFPRAQNIKGQYTEAPLWTLAVTETKFARHFPDAFRVGMNWKTGEMRLMANKRFVYGVEAMMPSLNASKRMMGKHAAIRVMIDYDALQETEYVKTKWQELNARNYVPTTTKVPDWSSDRYKLTSAPPSDKATLIGRQWKMRLPFLQIDAIDYNKRKSTMQMQLLRMLEETTGAERHGDFYTLPPTIDLVKLLDFASDIW